MKPKIKIFEHEETAEGYDIHEVMHFVEKKYGMDCYDIYASLSHFDKWCDSKGYGKKDSSGNKRSHSNIWFTEYKNDPLGDKSCPEYVAVLDWFIEEYMPDQLINEFDLQLKDFNKKEVPNYIKKFVEYVFKDFGKETVLVLNHEDE